MNCDQSSLLLDAYFDQELDLLRSLEVEKHVETCELCSGKLESLRVLRTSFRNSGLYRPAPATLERKIRASVKISPRRSQWTVTAGIWAAAAAALVITVLTAVLFRTQFQTSSQSELARDVVSSHVRSLMGNHLLDVQSSDHHTVKPWFAGKLDYSPPVVDLSAKGFALTGGRVDYLDGHNVAALIYKRRQHIINCYLIPDGRGDTALTTDEKNGFHMVHWRRAHIAYWLISDLNGRELNELASLLLANVQ